MKILMFGMSSYPGGIENYIVNYFCDKKFASENKIDFVTYENKIAYENKILECGYGIKYVPHLKKNPLGYRRKISRLLKENYDCVYINMLSAANKIPIVLAKKSNITNIIIHAHANSTVKGFLRHTLHFFNKKYCDKNATKRLACSNESAKWLFNFNNNNNKIIIVPNAIDVKKYRYSSKFRNEIREKYLIKSDELLLGSVGRFGPEKNNEFMIDILNYLLQKGIRTKLMLVGDGAMREALIKKIYLLGISDSVIFTGTIINPYKYYSAFDVFLFPSLFEGFGIAALEAQAAGLRCFCSNTLSSELNVSNTICYLNLKNGTEFWGNKIIEDITQAKLDRIEINEKLLESDYNIEKQIERLKKILYE